MIFSVEKRRFREDGELQKTRSYYLRYRIGDMPVDRWKSLGVTDKVVAAKKAQDFFQESNAKRLAFSNRNWSGMLLSGR